jgi:hypothetical protein
VDLIASGRTAEVFAWGEGRVLKLDRPEWNGLSALEVSALAAIAGIGVPAPLAHGTVTVDGRAGVVLDRVDGPILSELIATDAASPMGRFMGRVLDRGVVARGVDREQVDAWVRVVAAARLSEGFVGAEAEPLVALASGAARIAP